MSEPNNFIYLKRGFEVEKNYPTKSLVPAIKKRELLGSDQISADGNSWIRLDQHSQLSHLFRKEDLSQETEDEIQQPSEWRNDPRLKDRFHPDYPDDVQVLIHDGGPRFSAKGGEIVWVRIVGNEKDVWLGEVLNQPSQLTNVSQGDEIKFIEALGCEQLLYVTEKDLEERKDWDVNPCDQCGFDELFDVPSELIKKLFSGSEKGEELMSFTSFCPLCQGVQVINHKNLEEDEFEKTDSKNLEDSSPKDSKSKWKSMVRKLAGFLTITLGVIILSWVGYNFFIEMQPEAEGRNPIAALIISIALIYQGTQWTRNSVSSKELTQIDSETQDVEEMKQFLDLVTFDDKGFEYHGDEDWARVWVTPEDDVIALHFFSVPPDLPSGTQTLKELKTSYLPIISASEDSIVEFQIIRLDDCPTVKIICKTPQEPTGMTFIGSLIIPYEKFSYMLRVQCEERGMTGVRETLLLTKALKEGTAEINEENNIIKWQTHPDSEKYDAEFPDHPLSRLRRVLGILEKTVVIQNEVKNESRFPLP